MKNIVFKQMTVQNFMSIGDTPIVIEFEEGLNFITGYNEDQHSYNGVGKTTIINAFFFALFGQLYGDNSGKIKKADVVNNVVGGTALVTLDFDVDSESYEIIRSINPSKVSFLQKVVGEEDNDLSKTIPETNIDICKLIEGDADVYASTVVMDSDSKCFLLREPLKKVKFVENVTGLGVFSEMLKTAKAELSEVNRTLSNNLAKWEQLGDLIEREKKNKEEFSKNQKEKINGVEKTIKEYEEDILKLNKNAPEDQSEMISTNEKKIVMLDDKKEECKISQVKLQSDRNNILGDIDDYKKELKGIENLVCVTCRRPMEGHSEDEIESAKDNIKEKIASKDDELNIIKEKNDKVSEGLSKVNSVRLVISKALTQFQESQKEFESLSKEIEQIEYKIGEHKKRIIEINKEDNPFGSSLKDLKKDKKEMAALVKKDEETVEVLEYVKYLCSPEGVKSHIISKIVDIFNVRLNLYLKVLESPCTIEFNEFFDSVIKNTKNKEISYNSLSGGERKRVDVSLLFTFRDLRRMQSNISINVSMFDELFDSALCSTGIAKIVEILEAQAKENDECIYIITHRSEVTEDIDAKTVHLVKRNGVTLRVEEDSVHK